NAATNFTLTALSLLLSRSPHSGHDAGARGLGDHDGRCGLQEIPLPDRDRPGSSRAIAADRRTGLSPLRIRAPAASALPDLSGLGVRGRLSVPPPRGAADEITGIVTFGSRTEWPRWTARMTFFSSASSMSLIT